MFAVEKFRINKQTNRDDVIAEGADPGLKLVVVIKMSQKCKNEFEGDG